MTENPYVFLVSSGTARVGRAAVRDFYANHFLPQIPPDLEITSLSQTFDNDRIAEEMVNPLHPHDRYGLDSSRCATYGSKSRVRGSCDHPVPRRQSVHEHLYWDQATLLFQMGILDHPLAAAGADSAARLLKLR